MKKINALFCLLFAVLAAQAQKHEPVNTKKDQQQFDGYLIRLVPAKEGTYGYEVILGPKRIIYQTRNPFTASSRGLAKKEDAFAAAKFQVKQLKSKQSAATQPQLAGVRSKKLPAGLAQKLALSRNDGTLYNQRLSPKVAEQLKISITQ